MLVENVGWSVPLDVYDSGTGGSVSVSRVRGFQIQGVDVAAASV